MELFPSCNVSSVFLRSSIVQGPEVRSGDLPQPIMLKKGDEYTFTIKRGVGTDTCVSVNYDDFVNDVEDGDTLLIDGLSLSFSISCALDCPLALKLICGEFLPLVQC